MTYMPHFLIKCMQGKGVASMDLEVSSQSANLYPSRETRLKSY